MTDDRFDPPAEHASDDRTFDPVRPGTLTTLRRLAALKGYPPPRDNLTQTEAKDAISWLGRLKAGDDGKAVRLPAKNVDGLVPNRTLDNWVTERP